MSEYQKKIPFEAGVGLPWCGCNIACRIDDLSRPEASRKNPNSQINTLKVKLKITRKSLIVDRV